MMLPNNTLSNLVWMTLHQGQRDETTYKCDFDANIKHVVYTKCYSNFSIKIQTLSEGK